ncbi:hypothetical protein [Lysinibacillus sp. TE18511]
MGISDRGTKTKSITSCDNAFVTNIGAAAATLSRKKHLLARDPGAKRMFSVRKRSANVAAANVLSVRKRSVSNNKSGSSDAPRKLCSARKRSVSGKCFICAKAKRQQQSVQSERKSTTRYGNYQIYKIFSFSAIIERTRKKRSM